MNETQATNGTDAIRTLISETSARMLAARELRTCLLRWERMSAPPRRLTIPAVGCGVAVLERALRAASAVGASARAGELLATIEMERRRIAELDAWTRGQAGRSRDAWSALAARFWSAISDAIATGVIVQGSESHRHAVARRGDCEQQVAMCDARASFELSFS